VGSIYERRYIHIQASNDNIGALNSRSTITGVSALLHIFEKNIPSIIVDTISDAFNASANPLASISNPKPMMKVSLDLCKSLVDNVSGKLSPKPIKNANPICQVKKS